MRITSNIIQQAALSNLQSHSRHLHQAQQRVSTGLRVEKASDDPIAADGVMEADSSLGALDQYRRNIHHVRTRAQAEEDVLNTLSDALIRAKELAVVHRGTDTSEVTRRVLGDEVDQLYKQAVQLANTQLNGTFLFGGHGSTREPVDSASGMVNASAAGEPLTQIQRGLSVRASHNAMEVFGDPADPADPKVLDALRSLRNALWAGTDRDPAAAYDPAAVDAAHSQLEAGMDKVQVSLGEVGAWTNQLQVTTANLDALEINLKTVKADLREADFEEAVMNVLSRQNAFQAAMMATSRVMGMTLTDYLR